ncbi:sulfatase-like hydrolase/transferase [Prescottella defluvii]|uniref:sulfatase-like hydrolase/transferase n=1 Tax=Prescottella defluvii TaxID=1323361 RepID=UPI0004F2C068|nr:sulfatase-like hydrolase/transferase [Prescottella defluvii]
MTRRTLPAAPATEYPESARDYREQQRPFPRAAQPSPPGQAPNVLVVLLDDVGFGASSAYGGPCRMPTAERLADGGLKYSRFHTTALCGPTRAALLTGRNHHSVGMGALPDLATNAPGYNSLRPRSMATIAQILQYNGYATGAFGKMHQTPPIELAESGPFDRWPTREGFDRFYGFIGAETNQYYPNLIDGTTRIEPPRTPEEGYHLSEDLADQAIRWVRTLDMVDEDKPWFCLLSYGACHDPLQVPPGWRERYAGRFSEGWNAERHTILARQKELGLVPDDAELADWGEGVPLWEDLTPVQKVVAERLMETYAGMAEHCDAQTGRFIDAVEELGQLDNTLIFYVLGDNGASAEGGLYGTLNQVLHINHLTDDVDRIHARLDDIGGPDSYAHYPAGWALATNTPYRWAKQVASHYGGTRNGMIVHWPAAVAASGEVRHQWHHCIDVVPTILEAAGIPAPDSVDGVAQDPIEGVSMLYSFGAPDAPDRHTTQYFEMFGNRGVYHDGWTAVTVHKVPWRRGVTLPAFEDDVWELYDTTGDWTQTRDLAAEYPEKLAELQEIFEREARRHQVFPLDDRLNERFVAAIAGRRTPLEGRTEIDLPPDIGPLPEDVAPDVKNVSFTLTLDVDVPEAADGVLIAQGGQFGGWSVYVKQGVLTYCYNYADVERTYVRGTEALTPGRHTLVIESRYAGGELGAGAQIRMLVDGVPVGAGALARTLKFNFSIDEMLTVGAERGTSVSPEYAAGSVSTFPGRIHRVHFAFGDDRVIPAFAQKKQSFLASH